LIYVFCFVVVIDGWILLCACKGSYFWKRKKWFWWLKFYFVMFESSRLGLIGFTFERGKSDYECLNLILASLVVRD
jgi:hypothetical protein